MTKAVHEHVVMRLRAAGIPLDQWGAGKAKTLDHLIHELKDGEALLVGDGANLVRQVRVLSITVRCAPGDGHVYELVEDRQAFRDGRVRRRERRGVAEKLRPGELPEDSVRRAIAEELGLTGLRSLTLCGRREERRESGSYPGLQTEYVIHDAIVEIEPRDFRHAGYQEEQKDKVSYFRWDRI